MERLEVKETPQAQNNVEISIEYMKYIHTYTCVHICTYAHTERHRKKDKVQSMIKMYKFYLQHKIC